MKFITVIKLTVALSGILPGVAHAQVVLDDFNRANSGTPGPNWTVQDGGFQILSNTVQTVGTGLSLMTFNGQSSNAITVDVFHGAGGVQYGALVLGYSNLNTNLFVKVQDNGNGSLFDAIFFYIGNNGSSFGAAFTPSTVTPFSSARMSLLLSGTVATLTLDTNFDGIVDQTFTKTGVPTGTFGTGIGLGILGGTRLDNFALAPIPEPGTTALLVVGLLMLAIRTRRGRNNLRSS